MGVLEIRGLRAGYGAAEVVHDVDLSIESGEFVGLVGRNGMGKSTTMKALFGMARRFSGTVMLDGVPLEQPDAMARRGATFMPEDRGVMAALSVRDNLRLARRHGYAPAVDPLEEFPMLRERANQAMGTLSGGQQQLVGIARAIYAGSRLIVVDELTQGLQPSIVAQVFRVLEDVARSGVGVLVVDQSPQWVSRSVHRVLVMDSGRIVYDSPASADTAQVVSDLLILS